MPDYLSNAKWPKESVYYDEHFNEIAIVSKIITQDNTVICIIYEYKNGSA